MGEVSCLLRVRRYTEARLLALGAGVEAPEPEPFRLLRQLAESALVATDTVGPTNLWGLRGRPAVRSDAVIAVGVDDRGGLVRYDLPPVGGDAAAPVPADGSPDGPRVAHPKG